MSIVSDSVLIESKSARDNQLVCVSHERAREILQKVKALYFALWEGRNIATTEQVAEFYEIPAANIRKAVERHRNELESDGLKVLSSRTLKQVSDLVSLTSTASKITVHTPRSIVRLGMTLECSEIAKAVRTSLLDAVEKVVPALAQESTTIPAPSLPSVRERLENIHFGIDLFRRLGGCDPRTELMLKDHIRNILLEEKLQPALPGRVEWPVSDRAVVLGHRPTPVQLRKIGKEAVRLYQERHGHKPVQREQFVGGATRMVNVYGEADVDILDEAIALVMEGIQSEELAELPH